MGCYIHLYAEKRAADGSWQRVDTGDALTHQSYSVFGFLANVRNYSRVEPIAKPRGLPDDANAATASAFERWSGEAHTPSWLSIEELLGFDYSAVCEDRRALGTTVAKGVVQSYRDFLGSWFFDDLDKLKDAGAERIVFWFDN